MSKFSEMSGKLGKYFNVIGALRAGTSLHQDIPLAYDLMLDPRTPLRPKAWFAAKAVLMAVDAPLPFIGEVDVLVAVQAFRAFINSCEKSNPALVAEHRQALASGTGSWDRHVAAGIDTGKNFGQAIVSVDGPVRGTVRRIAVPSQDAARRITAPVRDVVRRITHRGGRELG